MALDANNDVLVEKDDIQYHEESTTVSPPSDAHAVGAEASMTWKTWLVIFVSAISTALQALADA